MTEIWKPVRNYEGHYEISNLGNVKSLKREVYHPNGNLNLKEKILNPSFDAYGYFVIDLKKDGIRKNRKVHQLVAEAFLNHTPNGYTLVVNHKNFIRNDNRVENLEIVTIRENTNQKHLKSTSKYTGVSWRKEDKKWQSQILINKKIKHLGSFVNEIDAHNAYQNELNLVLTKLKEKQL